MSINFDAEGGEIIKTIQDSVKVEILDVQPNQHVSREVFLAPQRDLSVSLAVASLTGLVDYINSDVDAATRSGPFVHVKSPIEVGFRNDIEEIEERRFSPLFATADVPKLQFDQYLKQEEAIIMLQARFFDTLEKQDLLEKLGNIVADEELRQEDDGVTQTLTLQQGIRRSETTIKNPAMLRPFRTFTEVEQPESPFIVRLKKQGDNGILVGFFEADGGAWRNKARLSISEFLVENIKDEIPVIA